MSFRVLIFLSVLLLSPSCIIQTAFLEPDEMPREKIASAVLRTPNPVLREGDYRDSSDLLRIVTVDGQVPRTLDNRVVLTPGPHVIQVAIELRRPNKKDPKLVDVTRSDTSIEFDAEPDGEYLVDTQLTGSGLFIWIVEEFEGRVVAGRHPSGATSLAKKKPLDE